MVADALFALLLAGLLAARFRWWLRYSPPVSAADIGVFSRRLSRMVYLVIYLIIGAQLIVNIVGGLRGDAGPGPGQNLGILSPISQDLVMFGLIALALIRVLAYLTWRRHRLSLEPRSPDRPSARPTAPSFLRPY
jgi:cytochrome b561